MLLLQCAVSSCGLTSNSHLQKIFGWYTVTYRDKTLSKINPYVIILLLIYGQQNWPWYMQLIHNNNDGI